LETLFLADEEGRPLLVAVVKATFVIQDGGLEVGDKQLPVNPTGEFWGDPDSSSYKYEPETAFIKPATDVVLIGHAYAPHSGATEVSVALRVGPLEKTVRVVGDRMWVKAFLGPKMTDPQPFERIPLVWERAFGGWDRSHPDPARHTFEPRNPVGTGFRQKHAFPEEGIRVPNLEDPGHSVWGYGSAPAPAGFGFTSPSWQPRAALGGTYDAAWEKQRMPLLPKNFDRRFFNAASAKLIADAFLKGDESVMVDGASMRGRLYFTLPGVAAPECLVTLVGRPDQHLQTHLDTVIINTDDNLLILLWRTNLVLRSGPHDVRSLKIETASAPDLARAT
jgi:hypothetical protein